MFESCSGVRAGRGRPLTHGTLGPCRRSGTCSGVGEGSRARRRGRGGHRLRPADVPDPRGVHRPRRRRRRGRAGRRPPAETDRRHPGHRAARPGRVRGLPAAARERRLDAGAGRDGARRRAGPGARPGARAPTTTSPSRSRRASWWPGSRRCCAAARATTAAASCAPVPCGSTRSAARSGSADAAGRADRDRVRPAGPPGPPPRPGLRARRAAGPGVGLQRRGQPHGRRPRGPAAGQARRAQPDPHGARRRLLAPRKADAGLDSR